MERRKWFKLAAGGVVPLLAAGTGAQEKPATGKDAPAPGSSEAWLKTVLEPGGFVMAYYLRDVLPQDGRPPLPEDPFGNATSPEPSPAGDPFAPAGKVAEPGSSSRNPSYSVLHPGPVMLDVAGMISRMKQQARVPEADAIGLMGALLDSQELLNPADCYEPRHQVVFYDCWGGPKGVVEICFTCQSFRTLPRDSPYGRETGDLLVAARLFDKLGISLGKTYPSRKVYEKSLRESRK